MTTPRLDEFASYMTKRHQVYLKRKAGEPGPWTDDPIISGGRFCNIFRELDTVTRWVDENIRQPYAGHPDLWFMLCAARYINWPDTLGYLIECGYWPDAADFHTGLITNGLQELAAKGGKVYTGAYMIRAESDPNKEWYSWTKHRYIAEIVLGRVWEKRRRFADLLHRAERGEGVTLERVWSMFQAPEFVGWGPFMAYEVVTDLRHTRYLRNAPDIYSWANAGPGAIRGLNRLYGRELSAHPKTKQTNDEMYKLMLELNCPVTWPVLPYNPQWDTPKTIWGPRTALGGYNRWFEMRDVEHTLCEFDKYERVRLGEGKMRSKYDWRKATKL
jgi:hypothetical protein